MTSSEYKFDKLEYETSRAQEFLKEHSPFSGFNFTDSDKFVINSIGNKICLSDVQQILIKENILDNIVNIDDIKKKLLLLSELIDKNAELFCQLEYMIRKISPHELKAYDLKLMTQNLHYCASNKFKQNWSSKKGLYMNNHSPLVILAYVAQQVLQTNQICIVSQEQTAVICWLFASLCKQAGNGCYAVVTSKSDIESAVDVLIETPARFPWNLKYIYVEESVEKIFRTTLEDKVRRSEISHVDNANKEKVFIFECAGTMELEYAKNAVIVETYRSVKELLSLLSPTPYCLSLWCDSITESFEISSKVQSNIVWVNGYGLFEGPPETSQSFFSIVDIACAEICQDLEVLESWQKMSTSERAARLKVFEQEGETEGSYYCVRGKYICAGTRVPVLVLVGRDAEVVFESSNTFKTDLMKVVVKGGRVILLGDVTQLQEVQQLWEKLKNVGAPMMSLRDDTLPDFSDIIYSRKVVWTSYGTIFSN